jgi:hypothetical protein
MDNRLPFRIASPCQENWQGMTPDGQGRHCAQCAKTVVDFTDWKTEDILFYLRSPQGRGSCGRFKASQLALPIPPKEQVVYNIWQTSMQLSHKVAAILLLFFSVSVSSCLMGKSSDMSSGGSDSLSRPDTVVEIQSQDPRSIMLGEPMAIDTSLPKPKKPPVPPPAPHGLETGEIEVTMGVPPDLPEYDIPMPPPPPPPPADSSSEK